MSKLLEKVEVRKERRIDFTYKGKEYSINVTNEGNLRLSVYGVLSVTPVAANCLIFEDKEE